MNLLRILIGVVPVASGLSLALVAATALLKPSASRVRSDVLSSVERRL